MKLHLKTARLRPTDVRRDIVAYLKSEASADSDFDAAELILGELVANVIRYAPGAVDVEVSWEHGFAILEIRDHGQRFAHPRPPPEPGQPNGHGLQIVAALARELSVRRIDGAGNAVRAVLPVTRK